MLLFKRNTLGYVGLRCDQCADSRDAGPLDVLQQLGWQIVRDDNGDDLCPQCNPAHPVGTGLGRRDTERPSEDEALHHSKPELVGRHLSALRGLQDRA